MALTDARLSPGLTFWLARQRRRWRLARLSPEQVPPPPCLSSQAVSGTGVILYLPPPSAVPVRLSPEQLYNFKSAPACIAASEFSNPPSAVYEAPKSRCLGFFGGTDNSALVWRRVDVLHLFSGMGETNQLQHSWLKPSGLTGDVEVEAGHGDASP